jgi:hypothetical protein
MINFMVYDECKEMTHVFSYDGNATIETFLKQYVKDHTDYESLDTKIYDTKIYVFKNGLKVLNSKKFISQKIKECIRDSSQINFIRKMDMI